MAELTEKQAEVFYFIKEYLEENGFPPTRQEQERKMQQLEQAVNNVMKRGY